MSYRFTKPTINYQPPVDLKPGDVVWVRWLRYRHSDMPETATPTKIHTVYPDGNIIHRKSGHDDLEFAWARDVFAKTPGLDFQRMAFRTITIKEIREYLLKAGLVEVDNA